MIYDNPESIKRKLAHCDFTPHHDFIARLINEYTYGNNVIKKLNDNYYFGAILVGAPGSGKTCLAEKIALELGLEIEHYLPTSKGIDALEYNLNKKTPACVAIIDCNTSTLYTALKTARASKRRDYLFFFEISITNFQINTDIKYIEDVNYDTFLIYKMPGISKEQIESYMKIVAPDVDLERKDIKDYHKRISEMNVPIGSFVNIQQHMIMEKDLNEIFQKKE